MDDEAPLSPRKDETSETSSQRLEAMDNEYIKQEAKKKMKKVNSRIRQRLSIKIMN